MFEYDAEYRALRRAGAKAWADDGFERANKTLGATIDRLLTAGLVPSAPARMLELGCGNGRQATSIMARKAYDVTGIDISETAISWAREIFVAQGLAGRFVSGSVCAMPAFANSSFDIVIDGSCLHCLVGLDRAKCLAEVARILRPAGSFVVSTMCGSPKQPKDMANFDARTRIMSRDGVPYRTFASADQLDKELTRSGFAVLDRSVAVNPWWDHATIVCCRA